MCVSKGDLKVSMLGLVLGALYLGIAGSAMAWDKPLWVRQFEPGTGASGVATDGDGNVYIAGTSGGGGFIAKLSGSGVLRWKQQIGHHFGRHVATDGKGNVYIAGEYDGGPPYDDPDAWVAKYSVAGALRWSRHLGSLEPDGVSGVTTDGDGNVYIAGQTAGQNVWGGWVAKYSAAGALRWKQQPAARNGASELSGVSTDGDGNVYIAGRIWSLERAWDIWVLKYSAAGVLRWNRQWDDYDTESGVDIATDSKGYVYILGAADSLGQSPLIQKYHPNGTLLWTQYDITTWSRYPTAMAMDDNGNIYVGGIDVATDPKFKAYIAKYSHSGEFSWVQELSRSPDIAAYDIAADSDGNVYMVGTIGSVYANPSYAFVAKYRTLH